MKHINNIYFTHFALLKICYKIESDMVIVTGNIIKLHTSDSTIAMKGFDKKQSFILYCYSPF